MTESLRTGLSRRAVLSSTAIALLLASGGTSFGRTVKGALPFTPFDHSPPETFGPGGWRFFTADEARAIEAIVERLIPADDLSMSGKDAGCATFIDRQLAGFYGSFERHYMQGPFRNGTSAQGDQSEYTPRDRYRLGLSALDAYCRRTHQKAFADLSDADRDAVLSGLETGEAKLDGFDGKVLFETVLANTMEGFFADPIYGGNKDMVSWKMIGFPGARYDYRDYVDLHNQTLALEPLSITGGPAWAQRG